MRYYDGQATPEAVIEARLVLAGFSFREAGALLASFERCRDERGKFAPCPGGSDKETRQPREKKEKKEKEPVSREAHEAAVSAMSTQQVNDYLDKLQTSLPGADRRNFIGLMESAGIGNRTLAKMLRNPEDVAAFVKEWSAAMADKLAAGRERMLKLAEGLPADLRAQAREMLDANPTRTLRWGQEISMPHQLADLVTKWADAGAVARGDADPGPSKVVDTTLPMGERIKQAEAAAKVQEAVAGIKGSARIAELERRLDRDIGKARDFREKNPGWHENPKLAADYSRLCRYREFARKALEDAQIDRTRAAHETILKAIDSPEKFSTFTSGLGEAGQKAHDEAMVFLNKAVQKIDGLGIQASGRLAVQEIPIDKEQRDFYSDSSGINSSRYTNAATMVHEFGHYLDHRLPGALAASQDFLKHRVGDEPLQSMNTLTGSTGYAEHEKGRVDDFAKAFGEQAGYVGKHYLGATEILSMGMEKLYRDPVGLAQKDPEYFKFVVGVMNGSLRKPAQAPVRDWEI